MNINYAILVDPEKEYHEKCEESIRELTENRDKACRQLQLAKQNSEKDK